MILTGETSLARVIDDHIDWFVAWHRLAFIAIAGRAEQAKNFLPPPGFAAWFKGPAQQLPQDQPVIDRIAVLHDQLHTLARLVLMKAPEGESVSEADYNAVTGKYHAFMNGVRRLERAFAVAASGLDLLTGLRSRVGLAEDLMREQGRFARTGQAFCLAIADIDHFKAINDNHGHDVGDHVLAAAADIISRSIRSFDDAYRLGGEEFLICLKETPLAQAQVVVERLRGAFAETPIAVTGKQPLSVTASFGLIESKREHTIEEMLHAADQALYRAKKAGRNRIEVA
ncbi:MAG: diguanylate cyclase [Alphaproteobacteria bacterium]|nr:diguanylate cyclase [Alphaproteobacteria bacterium]